MIWYPQSFESASRSIEQFRHVVTRTFFRPGGATGPCYPAAMLPYYNTAGACIPGEHYMLSPEPRFRRVMRLVDERKFFTLHAGRQTGKSTAAAVAGRHVQCGRSLPGALARRSDRTGATEPGLSAFRTILTKVELAFRMYWPDGPSLDKEQLLEDPGTTILRPLSAIGRGLRPSARGSRGRSGRACGADDGFLLDAAPGRIPVAFVRFPFRTRWRSCGMRQVRDYALSEDDRRAVSWLGTTSPFNITAEAATLEPFNRNDVHALLLQHTEHTGQRWESDAMDRIYDLSQGHPVVGQRDGRSDRESRCRGSERRGHDRPRGVGEGNDHSGASDPYRLAIGAELREDRVRRILEPMLAGSRVGHDVLNDDFAYVVALGLITRRSGMWEVANPIYREVIVRELTFVQQTQLRYEASWYVGEDGRLDMSKLMAAWQKFWRKDGHLAAEGFHYREAGPHLMLMAFLQRVLNGGGKIEREYGLGRGAVDLVVGWQGEQHVIELKLRRDTDTEAEAIEQVAGYLDTMGLSEGWLVLFDLRKDVSWEDKLFVREVDYTGKRIRVVGC